MPAEIHTDFALASAVTATAAPAVPVCISGAIRFGHSIKAVSWIEPYIDAEGYLVIRQAYDAAISEDGYLEVT